MSEKSLEERISEWVDDHSEEFLRDVARLVAVRSVRGEAGDGMPFGPGPRAALDEAIALCGEYGFKTNNYGGAVGTADLAPEKDAALDILGHLDVVGEGTGWDTDPYTAVIKDDGCMYGRGTDDDKGPVAAALTAMRCVRDLGLEFKGRVRLIMGTDEESSCGDLPYYYGANKPAPMTFTPDSGFPVYNTEKSMYAPQFGKEMRSDGAGPGIVEFDGGFRRNVIPSRASAVVAGFSESEIRDLLGREAEKIKVGLLTESVSGGVKITAVGIQGHAAYPEEANNGITALLHLLGLLPFAEGNVSGMFGALRRLFPHGDWRGKALGIAQADDISGELTASLNILKYDGERLSGQFDCRAPLCADDANTRMAAERVLRAEGFEISGNMHAAHHTPGESVFVQTLLRCYETYTGKKGECRYTGGGTYVHDIPGGVAFGAGMPGFNTNLHGANERMNVRDMITAVKIFALAVAELCCV